MERVLALYPCAGCLPGRARDGEKTVRLVQDAWSANQHVPGILAGTKPPVISDSGYITMGGADEATDYVSDCGPAWHQTPGAVVWLNKLVTILPNKPRAPGTVH